jgi:hypothetical protein
MNNWTSFHLEHFKHTARTLLVCLLKSDLLSRVRGTVCHYRSRFSAEKLTGLLRVADWPRFASVEVPRSSDEEEVGTAPACWPVMES